MQSFPVSYVLNPQQLQKTAGRSKMSDVAGSGEAVPASSGLAGWWVAGGAGAVLAVIGCYCGSRRRSRPRRPPPPPRPPPRPRRPADPCAARLAAPQCPDTV